MLGMHREFCSALAIKAHVHVVCISAINRANFLLLVIISFSECSRLV